MRPQWEWGDVFVLLAVANCVLNENYLLLAGICLLWVYFSAVDRRQWNEMNEIAERAISGWERRAQQ